MREASLIAVVSVLILSMLPGYGLGSSTQNIRDEFCDKDLKLGDKVANWTTAAFTGNVSHSLDLHVIFVGYDEGLVDTDIVNDNVQRYYELPYDDAFLQYTFKTDYAFTDQSYLDSLKSFILEHSVTGSELTSAVNETALRYQRETGTRMSIFLPQSGRAIDAYAVEQWFADNPYQTNQENELGYTFYVLNFTEFDSPDHSLEHWYNFSRYDVEAKSINDYWRLEWDNPLNPDVKFPYPAFTSRYRLLFVDPSAFQWYLTWARIWRREEPYMTDPKYDYYYEDLDGYLASHDVTTPDGKSGLALYLAGWIDDFVYNLLSPVAWPLAGDTLSLQVLVLNNCSEYGYSNEKMKWILNSTLVEEEVNKLAPYMQVKVSVKFENLSSYPEMEETLKNTFLEEKDGWRYYDGYQLFFALQSVRDGYFNMKAADITVNSYVFLLKNASLETMIGGEEFTGLGGYNQVLVLKSIDRYFRPDGATPKSGLGYAMIHELGHNIAFPHTFSFLRYAGDFADDAMGYYAYGYSFCKMRTDMFRRTLVDMKLLELKKALRKDAAWQWPWPRKTMSFRDILFNVINSEIDTLMQLYDGMDYLGGYYIMAWTESIEEYLREVVTGIAVPGDINGDGKCHLEDKFALIKAYGSTPTSPNWNPNADLDRNRIVDLTDRKILDSFFGQKAKVVTGFFTWKTGARTTAIDIPAIVFPEYDIPYTEMNITYGLWNWDKRPHSSLVRISQITMSNLIKSVYMKIYNETTTMAELTWTAGAPTQTEWVKLTLDPSTKYSIMIEVIGTMEAFYDLTLVTLECRQLPLGIHAFEGRPQNPSR